MSDYKIKGKIKMIGVTADVSATIQKRELVVSTDEQYPQHILINFTQGKCNLLDGFKPGEEVNVSVNIRGREWVNPQGESKYFNDIQGWQIARVMAPAGHTPEPMPHHADHPTNIPPKNQGAPQQQTANFEDDENDLPF